MFDINYKEVEKSDTDDLIILMLLLYKNTNYNDLLVEIEPDIKNDKLKFFLAIDSNKAVGFAHCSLRYDYVEGTEGGKVGYLEGIYVLPEYRRMGIARSLLEYCEEWSRKNGCKEFASDCQLDNIDSYNFHMKMNFFEANRVICFTKKLR